MKLESTMTSPPMLRSPPETNSVTANANVKEVRKYENIRCGRIFSCEFVTIRFMTETSRSTAFTPKNTALKMLSGKEYWNEKLQSIGK